MAEIRVEGDIVQRDDHRPTLDSASRTAAERIRALLDEAGLETPSLRDLAAQLALDEGRTRDLLAHLEREGGLVRAPGDLWFAASAVAALRERVREHFRTDETLETPHYKALIGTSRRTAVPLMELFDAQRLTLRRGDVRRLRAG